MPAVFVVDSGGRHIFQLIKWSSELIASFCDAAAAAEFVGPVANQAAAPVKGVRLISILDKWRWTFFAMYAA